MENIKTIDIHSHIFIPEAFSTISDKYSIDAPRLIESSNKAFIKIGNNVYGPFPPAFYSIKDRLEKMKRGGIELQLLSVHPNTFFYNLNIEEAKEFSRSQNDSISEVANHYSEHFRGLATVPLQDVQEAIKEMERAILKLHMVGVEIGTNVNGKYLGDPIFKPFFKKAEELNACIFIHPANPVTSERITSYYLPVLVGNPCDTTLAIASMIFGGIFDEFPRLKVCVAHGGGFFPYQIGRLDKGFLVRDEIKKYIKNPPSFYIKRILFDTVVYDVSALKFLISQVGPENVILGTDFPTDMEDENMIRKIIDLGLPDSITRKILYENASQILGVRF